jgi:hypothetical protein
VRLFACRTESEQAAWAVAHLKRGGRIHDISLRLGGVDRPMRVVAAVKQMLRAEGRRVSKAIETVCDAEGEDHQILAWRLGKEIVEEEVGIR